ncbi:hypothetical protein Tco_0381094 [Tanacetum coccineum]
MASQEARFSKFEADFKQQQSEMTKKINTVLKAITERITGALPSDTVKNPKLNVNTTTSVLSARSYPTKDPQCSTHGGDGDVMFIEIVKKNDDSHKEELEAGGLEDLEKEHTKSVYLKSEEDKRRGVEYVMSKILGFYKQCLDLGPEYVTGIDDEEEVM